MIEPFKAPLHKTSVCVAVVTNAGPALIVMGIGLLAQPDASVTTTLCGPADNPLNTVVAPVWVTVPSRTKV